jgi:hypothetical protein
MSVPAAAEDRDSPPPSTVGGGAGSRAPLFGWLAALVLVVAGVALRLNDLGTLSVNGDEIYTIWETRSARTAAEGVDVVTAWRQRLALITQNDPTPPQSLPRDELWRLRWGYRTNPLHLLANEACFALAGDSPLAARLSSCVFGLLALLVLPLLARGLFGDRFALMLLAVLAFSPNAIEHARFARYYSAAFFLGALAALAAARFTLHRRRGDEWLFVVSAAALVLAHSTGVLVALLLLLWMAFFARSRVAQLSLAAALLLVAAAWWFGPLKKLVDTIDGGIRPTSVYCSWRMMAGLFYNVGPGLVALGGLALFWWPARGRRLPLVPVAGTVLVSCWTLFSLNYRHDIGPRYFAAVEGVGALMAAAGLERLAGATVRVGLSRLAGFALLLAQGPLLASNAADGQRFPIEAAVQRLARLADPGDGAAANWAGIYKYYLDRGNQPLKDIFELPNSMHSLEAHLLDEGNGRTRAFLVLERQRGQLSWTGPSQPLADWLVRHGRHVETLGLERFDSPLERFGAGYRYELSIYEVDLSALRRNRG